MEKALLADVTALINGVRLKKLKQFENYECVDRCTDVTTVLALWCMCRCGKSVQVLYLCAVASLLVVVVLGGQLAVCVFIGGYTVIVMLVIVNAYVQWV